MRFCGATITDMQIAILVLAVLIMLSLTLMVRKTRLGRAMRATAQSRQVASLMGVDVNRVIAATFVIGSALAAIAGVMVSAYYGLAHYYMGFLLGLKAFSAAVLGGIGNLAGAMLGGLLLGVDRIAGRRLHRRPDRRISRQQLSGRVRVFRADCRAGIPAIRAIGGTGCRTCMMA